MYDWNAIDRYEFKVSKLKDAEETLRIFINLLINFVLHYIFHTYIIYLYVYVLYDMYILSFFISLHQIMISLRYIRHHIIVLENCI